VDAYNAHWRIDTPGAVLRAAAALDVGAARFMHDMKFSLERLGKPPFGLAATHPLRRDMTELWHTRSAIMHRGVVALFDRRPEIGVPAKASLTRADVDRFLRGVPELMQLAAP
jgi:hypothetical protein